MTFLLSIIGALALASIPLLLGWRRTYSAAQMARQMGVAPPEKRIDLEKIARQTGTGLTLNQILFGFLTWAGGGFVAGLRNCPLAFWPPNSSGPLIKLQINSGMSSVSSSLKPYCAGKASPALESPVGVKNLIR